MDPTLNWITAQACAETGGWLALRFVGLGLCWSWLLPMPDRFRIPRGSRWILAAACAALLGLLLSTLTAWGLAEGSLYRADLETAALLVLAAAGLVGGAWRLRGAWMRHMGEGLPGLLLAALGFAVVLGLPNRGEWIAGGWDPGIYVGEGMRVEREETLRPGPEPFLAGLAPEEWELFTREQPEYGFTEYLPVVPIDRETARMQPFFFRLTSCTIAILARCGGLHAAMRVNLVLGLVTALLMAGLLIAQRQPVAVWGSATALLLLHPIWVFMAHFPTSEMLQLVWVLGLGLLLPYRFQNRAVPWLLALVLFAGMLNRFSFLPFAGLFLCAMSWMDLPREHRDPCFRSRLLLVTALLVGGWVNLLFCGVTLVRLGTEVPRLVVAGLVTCLAAVLVEALALMPACRRFLARAGAATCTAAFGVACVLLVAGDVWPALPWRVNLVVTLRGAMPFLGWAWLVAAGAGLAALAVRPSERRTLSGFVFFLLGSTLATVAFLSIAGWYPWAARRFLEFTVPALCLLGGVLVGLCWGTERYRAAGRAAAVLVVAGLVWNVGRSTRDAWRHTEFNGLAAVLAQAAERVEETDLVVADHFRWGTPLRLVFGRQVLNGEVWWQDGDAASTAAAMERLAVERREGRRILFLTSTEEGLGVYAVPVGPVEVVWDSGPMKLAELAHRPRQRGFRPVVKEKRFVLYAWEP